MIKRSFGTHNGSFHADEVTACALLLLMGFIDRDKIFRTREKDVLKNVSKHPNNLKHFLNMFKKCFKTSQ